MQCQVICGERAGDAAGERTGLAELGVTFAVFDIHVVSGCCGSRFATIDREELPVALTNQNETTAADSRVEAINDAEREACGDSRIDGIAAMPHCIYAGACRDIIDRG